MPGGWTSSAFQTVADYFGVGRLRKFARSAIREHPAAGAAPSEMPLPADLRYLEPLLDVLVELAVEDVRRGLLEKEHVGQRLRAEMGVTGYRPDEPEQPEFLP